MFCHIFLILIATAHAGFGIVPCKVCVVEYCGMAVGAGCATACAALVWAYPICVAGCLAAGCSPCVPVCASIGAGCFANDTKISTPQGDKLIADVSEGDLVRDIKGSFTRVVENVYMPGRVEMTTLKVSEPESSLTVTRDHWQYILRDQGQLLPVQARDITAGMMSIRSSAAANSTVAKTVGSIVSGRWALSTASCSVYANGILSGTLCSNESAPLYMHQLEMITEAKDYNIFN